MLLILLEHVYAALINPRHACAARVTVVGSVCVCVWGGGGGGRGGSVKSHLTSEVSVGPEITVTYSAGNGGQKICGVFSETAPLQRSSTATLNAYVWSTIFLQKARMHII